ncbi:VOC family protein [Streptomyces natalensis]|uniref:Hydrolase n=1 Tax=Streptomyces natalensis ATCC 27448 TaxID=1240678 RepID=A0A0D7CB69_9ACTN|nr:VOC family protein [Streptomyces natalensis]KIZ13498.1 hydrolase [Streptomyces natalensis ATCC 27448]
MTALADGAPCWADVMLPDLERGKRFYGGLLGWTFSESAPASGGYTQALRNGKRAAGLMPRQGDRAPTAWGLYFATGDIERTAALIRGAGGRILTAPMEVGALGTMLIAADPSGAVFGAWQAGAHRGFETGREPGAYLWMGLHTRDAAAADAFYGTVFGFEGVTDSPMARPGFLPWRLPGQAREIGCRVEMDATYPQEAPAHVLVCFLVDAMDAAVRTATGLGGSVVIRPQPTPGGPFAVFCDNQGAGFGVIGLR